MAGDLWEVKSGVGEIEKVLTNQSVRGYVGLYQQKRINQICQEKRKSPHEVEVVPAVGRKSKGPPQE